MLPLFILGIILALGLALVLRQAVQVPPRQLLRVLGWTVGGLLLVTVLFLAVTGRLSWAFAGLAALLPWAARLMRLMGLGRGLWRTLGALGLGAGGFGTVGRGGAFGRTAHPDPDPDDRSAVSTRFLTMTLSHGTGAMTGSVRAGRFAGRDLDSLSRDEVAALAREVRGDPESARVLDAWLERVHPDWRQAAPGPETEAETEGGASAGSAAGPMTRAEALAVLGLEEGASADDVRAAHRRLIVLVHPDRGGTPYLAARLNQARDVLLRGGS